MSPLSLSSSLFLGRRRHFRAVAIVVVPLFGTTATLLGGFRCCRPIFWDDDDTFGPLPLSSSHFLGRRRHFRAVAIVVVPLFGTTTTLSGGFRCCRPIFWDDGDTFGPFPLSSSHFLGRRRHFGQVHEPFPLSGERCLGSMHKESRRNGSAGILILSDLAEVAFVSLSLPPLTLISLPSDRQGCSGVEVEEGYRDGNVGLVAGVDVAQGGGCQPVGGLLDAVDGHRSGD